MKKRDLKRIFASFLIASIALTGCNTGGSAEKTEQKPKEETAESEETKEVNIEETDTAKQTAVFTEIKTELDKATAGQPVDWDLVLEKYNGGLQGPVSEINGEYDQAIQTAIAAGKSGELEPVLAKQLVDKLTQSYFYQKQKSLQKEAATAVTEGKQEDAKLLFEQIKYLANQIFIPTAAKRDEYYQLAGESSIVENINSGLSAQEEALNANKAEDFGVYVQLTDKSIYRSYYLAAKSYAEKIEAAVKEGKNASELKIMQVEAWGFLQAIKQSLSGGDEAATAKLDEIFSLNTTDPSTIKAEEVSSLFAKAIAGKIKGYYEKAPQAAEAIEAKTEALEGNMFLKALEQELTKKLGEQKAAETLTAAEEFYNLIADNKPEEAKATAATVIEAVDQLIQ
ncbi:hypothetical protein CVD25_20195 [Bacillus canaveralius]|uniref:Lipoprotein n=1 Tax=Bacillus canaveralius TaxID=1403243 RepID=A0A2N5GFQ7_9BACI|nr:hypothetical protein [Bacillus canaveralius]PLR79604.1 hypothetical protein CU635_22335 [Bacillus canaveralius]PLR90088.1 hypothetical protein CVD25_20195 [Bacillus canaveralius]